MTSELVLEYAIDITFALILLAMGFAFLRMVLGPSLPDRVVALDLITTLVVSFVAVFSVRAGEPELMDVIVAVALIAFLATLAYARYCQKVTLNQSGVDPKMPDDGDKS